MNDFKTISKKYGPTLLTMTAIGLASSAGASTASADLDPATIFNSVQIKALAVIVAAGGVAAVVLPARAGLKIIVGWAKALVGMAK